jgi:hypothetical protein
MLPVPGTAGHWRVSGQTAGTGDAHVGIEQARRLTSLAQLPVTIDEAGSGGMYL